MLFRTALCNKVGTDSVYISRQKLLSRPKTIAVELQLNSRILTAIFCWRGCPQIARTSYKYEDSQVSQQHFMLPCSEWHVLCCSVGCPGVVSFWMGRFFTAKYSSRILHWIFNLSLAENKYEIITTVINSEPGIMVGYQNKTNISNSYN